MKSPALRIVLSCLLCGALPLPTAMAGQRPPPLPAAPGTTAPRLLATFVHPQASRSMAVVRTGDAPAQTVHVGQTLADGLSVHAIESDHLVLLRGGQRFALPLLGQPASAKARTRPGTTPPARQPEADTRRDSTRTAAAATKAPLLSAEGVPDVRAACSDTALMNALPEAQQAEMNALGVCTPH